MVFMKKLKETLQKYSFLCYAYCLTPKGYHLLVRTPLPNISEGMHYLNSAYANWFRNKYRIKGSIFQGRYRSLVIEPERYLLLLTAYIHLVPLKEKLVVDIDAYPWSSYGDYMGCEKTIEGLRYREVLHRLDRSLKRARSRYKRLLGEVSGFEPFRAAHRGVILGDRGFINRLISDNILPEDRYRDLIRYTPEEIYNVIISEFSISREEIFLRKRGNGLRQLSLYMLKSLTPLTLKEIGRLYGMDYAAVAQACRRFELRMASDSDLSETYRRLLERLRQRYGP